MDAANQQFSKPIDVDVHAPAFDAYAALKSQFDGAQARNSAANLGNSVSESELDKLSLVWLAQRNSDLGRDVTRDDLQAPQPTQFDSLMASHVNKQYESIRHAHFDPEGGFMLIGSHDKDALTRQDIDKSLETVEQQRKSLDYADPLSANDGALFFRLSREHDGVRSINYWDLKEARSTDDYERSRGTRLFTDDERKLIDRMYHRWGKDDMRQIEERSQTDTMGCDGEITKESLAKGTGFQNVQEMSDTFNPAPPDTRPSDAEAARQQAIIEGARRQFEASVQSIEQQARYTVQPGQGFDRIARDVMTHESGTQPTERNVVDYSRQIASMNGDDRDTYDPKTQSLQPGQSISVHDGEWKLNKTLDAAAEIDDTARRQIDNTN